VCFRQQDQPGGGQATTAATIDRTAADDHAIPKLRPSYPDVCLDPDAVDYDCAGGSGDGPEYVEGQIRVRAPDPCDLDRDGDGWG
jgi:hypothetical protein